MSIGNFFKGEKKPSTAEPVPELFLPWDVRYAIQYKEGLLGASEMKDLVNNGFKDLGLYLCLKASANDPELQRAIISKLAKAIADHHKSGENLETSITALAEESIDALPEHTTVQGAKLALISRQGINLWRRYYREAAEKYAKESSVRTFIVGHATFIGLSEFLRFHEEHQKPLHILIPNFIDDNNREICGYRVVGADAVFLPKNFDRDSLAVVVDDIFHTGDSNKKIKYFWSDGSIHPLPRFDFLYKTTDHTNV